MIFSQIRSLRTSLRNRFNRPASKRLLRKPLPLRMECLEDRRTPATLIGLTTTNQLLTFDSATPTVTTTVAVTGITGGANLIGIDFRPATGALFGLSSDSHLYTINQTTGVATDLGTVGPLDGTFFGFDFNPLADRIRIVSSTGQNLAINPDLPPGTTVNTPLNGPALAITGAAYSNNFAGTAKTTLYGINGSSDTLYIINPPGSGTTSMVGVLGIDSNDQIGFDIATDDGVAYATLTDGVSGFTSLYTINLASGAATLVGAIGKGDVTLAGLAAETKLNTPPVVAISNANPSINAGSATPVTIDPAIAITDLDSADFNGGSLTIAITNNGAATDNLTIPSVGDAAGQFKVAGSDVFFEGNKIGTFTGGLTGTSLIISFSAAVTPATVQSLAQSIQFGVPSTSAAANVRTITFTANDGDGGINLGASGAGIPAKASVTVIDVTAPTVVSVNFVGVSPTNAASVSYLVTFSENVSGVDVTDFTLLPTVTGATIASAVYDAASFTATVTVNGIAGDGSLQLNLIDDDTIVDTAGNKLGGTGLGNGDKSSAPTTIDQTAPTATSITLLDGNPTSATSVDFLVSFSENVSGVDATDFTLLPTVTGATISNVVYDALAFTAKVTVSGIAAEGMVQLNLIDNDSIVDAAGNKLGGTGLVNGDKSSIPYIIDQTLPVVVSSIKAAASPTNATSVAFTVTFSEDVTGVDPTDFTLTNTGTVIGGGITVTGSGKVYTVTANGVGGDGTLRLDLIDDDTIVDAASGPLGGAGKGNADFKTGEAYTIDNTAPAVSSSVRVGSNPTKASSVVFTVTFSESVTGVDITDFTVNSTGTIAGAKVATVAGSGSVYTVTVDSYTGEGNIRLDFVDDDTVVDAAGNPTAAGFTAGEAFTIDLTAPTVVSSDRADPDPTKATTVNFTVTFSEAVTGVDVGDFKVNVTGNVAGSAVSKVTGSGSVYTVTVTVGSGNGTLQLEVLDDDTIIDLAGTELGGAGVNNGGFTTGQVYTIDLPPVVLSVTRNDPNPTKAATVAYTVTFSEDVTGVDLTDFGLTLSGALSGVSFTGISGSGSVYIVSVGTGMGSGSGTIRLDVVANGTIVDATANPLTAAFMGGQVYDIDRLAPTVVTFDRAAATSNGAIADFNITFSEDVTGVDPTDFTIIRTGTVAGGVVTVTGTGANRVVTVSGLTGDGTVSVSLVDDDTIVDAALNPLGGVGAGNGDATSAQATGIDQTPPTATIDQTTPQNDPASSQPVNFTVTFNEKVTGFDKTDIILGGVAGLTATTVVVTTTDGITYNVAVSGATTAGAITIDFAAGAAADEVGNASVAPTIIDNSVTVTANAPPTITAKASVSGTEDVNLVFSGVNLISIADPDAGTDDVDVTLAADKGVLTLSAISGLFFITGDGTSDAVLRFTGKISDINAALNGLIFKGDLNVNGAASLVIHVDDLGHNGLGNPGVGDATVAIDLAPVNDAPTVTAPAAITIAENKSVTFSGTNVITVADVDLNGNPIQVTLSGANGKFVLASQTGITIIASTDPDGPTITFKGLLADVNNALNGAQFVPNDNFNGSVTITTTADDLSATPTATGMATTLVTITAVNSSPTITGPTPLPITILEDKSFTFSGTDNLLTISDPDAGTGALKVSVAVTKGTLTLSGVTGLTFTVGDGTGDASMTFTGTLTAINAALLGSTYNPTLNFNGGDTLTVNVDDQGNTGGTSTPAVGTFAISVTAVNDAPVAVNDSFSTTQNKAITIAAPGLLANDTDPEGTALSLMQVGTLSPNKGFLQLSANGSFVFTPQANFVGTVTFQYQATDGLLNSNTATVTITITENFRRIHATGAGPGGTPHVLVYNEAGTLLASFLAFDAAFTGGVDVATGDVDGDGVEDIIVGAGPGGGPHVRVVSGADLHQIMSFYAFDQAFTGGVSVAAGDVNGDGRSDVIVGAGPGGGPHVKVFAGAGGQVLQQFFAYSSAFTGGVDVASGDYNGDGFSDIVTGAGPGGGPHVVVYQGMSGQTLRSFYAFDQAFTGGVNVAAGEFQGNAAIFAAAGPGGVPIVNVFDFNSGLAISSFMAFEQSQNTGVHIGTEVKFDGTTTLFLAAGFGSPPSVRVLSADNLLEEQSFNAYDPAFLGGVFVG